jgi:hypothetical protein
MAKLSTAERASMPSSDFVYPATKEYPIADENHARVALSDCKRDPRGCGAVRAAVKRRYPQIDVTQS